MSAHNIGSETLGIEAAVDLLGAEDTAKDIVSDITMAYAAHPRIIGLYGKWGTGKTSMLNRLGPKLAAHALVCCFPAWKYEAEGSLSSSFIRTLAEPNNYPWNQMNLTPAFLPDWKKTVIPMAKNLLDIGLEIAIRRATHGSDEAAKAIRETLSTLKEHSGSELVLPEETATEIYHLQLRELIEAILKRSDRNTIFVLIDDLDRCSPDSVVEMINWMKTHLLGDQIRYILALDRDAVARAILARYRAYSLGLDAAMISKAISQTAEQESGYAGRAIRTFRGYPSLSLKLGHEYIEKIIETHYYLSPMQVPTLHRGLHAALGTFGLDSELRSLGLNVDSKFGALLFLIFVRCSSKISIRAFSKIYYKFKVAVNSIINRYGSSPGSIETVDWVVWLLAEVYESASNNHLVHRDPGKSDSIDVESLIGKELMKHWKELDTSYSVRFLKSEAYDILEKFVREGSYQGMENPDDWYLPAPE